MWSIFFQGLFIRNTLDVMHCEKNICENVIRTIFGTKDILAMWKHLEQCEKQPHLCLQANGVGFIKPIASYVLTYG
jgi:hypothetical protein